MQNKYNSTLNLPLTSFSMKANLPVNEPLLSARWEKEVNPYASQLQDRESFILLDGPPYANNRIHLGHAYNKILKDIVYRSKYLEGYSVDAPMGWDCHGLPIEKQIHKTRDLKEEKDSWLKKCRQYANEQVQLQEAEFKTLGLFCSNQKYLTMSKNYEADAIRIFSEIWKKGYIYPDLKPVHWCYQCESSLSHAEINYQNLPYTSLFFKQRIVNPLDLPLSVLPNTYFIVWTTTPWTVSENQALAANKDIEYVYISNDIEGWIISSKFWQSDLEVIPEEMKKNPPQYLKGSSFLRLHTINALNKRISPLYLADFVEDLHTATGIVHIAPAHGEEDYKLSKKHGFDNSSRITTKGTYSSYHDLFPDQNIFEVDKQVIEALTNESSYVYSCQKDHSYPTCWRHKSPLYLLATDQWFINLQCKDLVERTKVLLDQAIIESQNPNFLSSLKIALGDRKEWCISRQRSWGLPMPLFVHHMTEDLHPETYQIMEKVAAFVETNGIEAFICKKDFSNFIEDAENYKWVGHTLDIWFDSGCVPFISDANPVGKVADLLIEGQDQYRGWFQSTLLIGVILNDSLPYRDLLVHGYVLDESQNKMSKSIGNVIDPQSIISQYGVSILRYWVCSMDLSQDIAFSGEILESCAIKYRKIRNTIRFLLGAIHDSVPQELLKSYDLNLLVEIDKYILQKAKELGQKIQKAYRQYKMHHVIQYIYDFCLEDLSAFYIHHTKNRQYVLSTVHEAYKSKELTSYYLLEILALWITPILPHLAQEYYSTIKMEDRFMKASWLELDKIKFDSTNEQSWDTLRQIYKKSLVLFEQYKVSMNNPALQKADCSMSLDLNEIEDKTTRDMIVNMMEYNELSQFFGVAQCKFGSEGLEFSLGKFQKCNRCWLRVEKLNEDICEKCWKVLNNQLVNFKYL